MPTAGRIVDELREWHARASPEDRRRARALDRGGVTGDGRSRRGRLGVRDRHYSTLLDDRLALAGGRPCSLEDATAERTASRTWRLTVAPSRRGAWSPGRPRRLVGARVAGRSSLGARRSLGQPRSTARRCRQDVGAGHSSVDADAAVVTSGCDREQARSPSTSALARRTVNCRAMTARSTDRHSSSRAIGWHGRQHAGAPGRARQPIHGRSTGSGRRVRGPRSSVSARRTGRRANAERARRLRRGGGGRRRRPRACGGRPRASRPPGGPRR